MDLIISHGQPTDPLIFYISGLSSTTSYIGPSSPDQWIFYIHGQPTDPLIFYISGLSSTPSLHWLTYSPPDQWILYVSMVNPQTHWIFYISGLSSTPSLHWLTSCIVYLNKTHWIFCPLYPWSITHRPIDLLISVVCPLPLLYIGLHPPHLTNGSIYIHGQPSDPLIFYISGLSSTNF